MQQSNRLRQLHRLPSSANWNWEKYKRKRYLHFDEPIHIHHFKKNLQSRTYIATHAFLPFIHYNLIFKRYRLVEGESRKRKDPKTREICFASHKDQFIYKYYGDLLNEAYNDYAKQQGIHSVAIAYRNNLGKNNIDFAYEVFDFLYQQNEALIVSIDFENFFGSMHHGYLKRNMKEVLGVDELPEDWYKVFRNITKYSYIEKMQVDEWLKDRYGIKKFRSKKSKHLLKFTPQDFRALKAKCLKTNKENVGIPQGSAMSAVSSNVFLIHLDQALTLWARHHGALYRRYSDDLILVIPSDAQQKTVAAMKEEILAIIHDYSQFGLKIQEKKTEIRLYQNERLYDEKQQLSNLDYLGFVTDGSIVRLREKSLFKYYSRAYRKAKVSKRIGLATGQPSPKRELYTIYTHLGKDYQNRGNFITYAHKAHQKMKQLKVKSLIRRQVKRHWSRIHRRMK